eukprot:3562664-Pyramimonas_sp.AAC.1
MGGLGYQTLALCSMLLTRGLANRFRASARGYQIARLLAPPRLTFVERRAHTDIVSACALLAVAVAPT